MWPNPQGLRIWSHLLKRSLIKNFMKNSEKTKKQKPFWYLHGVEKGNICLEWVKHWTEIKKQGLLLHISVVKLYFNLCHNKATSSNSFLLSSNLFEDLSWSLYAFSSLISILLRRLPTCTTSTSSSFTRLWKKNLSEISFKHTFTTRETEGTLGVTHTAWKMKFSIKDFFSKCDQIAGNCRFGHIYWRNS